MKNTIESRSNARQELFPGKKTLLAFLAALGLGACEGQQRQGEDEESGTYRGFCTVPIEDESGKEVGRRGSVCEFDRETGERVG